MVLLASFFEGGNLRLDEGFLRLGMVVCGLTTLIGFIYFPDHGSMLLRALSRRPGGRRAGVVCTCLFTGFAPSIMSLSSPTRRPPVPHCALCCALLLWMY